MLNPVKTHQRHRRFAVGFALVIFLLLLSGAGRGEPADRVDETIQYLIGYVSGSGLTYIRNGNEYTPDEAAEHMSSKYQHFRNDIETPEEFIELCATRSLLTGKPYLVVDGQGKQRRTSEVLRGELAAYRTVANE